MTTGWKTITILLLLAAAALIQFWLGGRDAAATPGSIAEPRAPQVARTGAAAAADERIEVRTPTTQPQASPRDTAANQHSTTLVVRVQHARDQTPAIGVGVRVQAQNVAAAAWSLRDANTDADGSARFEHLAPGPTRVELDRGVTQDVELAPGQTVELTLQIPPTVDVEGIVVDHAGRGVGGAEIWLGGFDAAARPILATHARADGTFDLRDAGTQRFVSARSHGHAPSTQHELRGDASPVHVRLVLPAPGGALRGQVLDSAGRPVAQALVQLGYLATNSVLIEAGKYALHASPRHVTTGGDGRFEAHDLPAGRVPIVVRGQGCAPWRGEGQVPVAGVGELTITLAPAVTLTGHVRDQDSRPIAGAKIQVAAASPQETERFNTVRTGADGAYALRTLAPGTLEVIVTSPGRQTAIATLAATAGAALQRDFVLAELGSILLRGRVVDEGRKPVHASLRLRSEAGPAWGHEVEADEHGAFEVPGCPVALLQVVVSSGIHPMVTLQGVDPTRGELEIVLRNDQVPTARIRGRVLRQDQRIATDAGVVLAHERGLGSGLHTVDADTGVFDLGPLPPDPYYLRVLLDQHAEWKSPVRVLMPHETWDIGDIRPTPLGTLVIRARSSDATPLADRIWNLHGPGGELAVGLGLRAGAVRARIAAGTYELRTGEDHVEGELRAIVIRAGEETILDVVVRR